jgi:hypothetical protein
MQYSHRVKKAGNLQYPFLTADELMSPHQGTRQDSGPSPNYPNDLCLLYFPDTLRRPDPAVNFPGEGGWST